LLPARQSQGWTLWFTELFDARWRTLRARVKHLRVTLNASAFKAHPDVKLFAALVDVVHDLVPANPAAPQFLLGNTLGPQYRGWRRVKGNGMPARMRLFFKFSASRKVLVYAWLNDETTLRKQGGGSDVYAVFQRMLKAGNPPDGFEALMKKVATGK
jgi:toxin YhaV